jgi:hypothetical protein
MSLASLAGAVLAQQTGNGGGFFVGVPCFGGLIGLAALVLWIWALVDAIGNSRLNGNLRLIWVLVIIFVPFLGPILYFLVGRNG